MRGGVHPGQVTNLSQGSNLDPFDCDRKMKNHFFTEVNENAFKLGNIFGLFPHFNMQE